MGKGKAAEGIITRMFGGVFDNMFSGTERFINTGLKIANDLNLNMLNANKAGNVIKPSSYFDNTVTGLQKSFGHRKDHIIKEIARRDKKKVKDVKLGNMESLFYHYDGSVAPIRVGMAGTAAITPIAGAGYALLSDDD